VKAPVKCIDYNHGLPLKVPGRAHATEELACSSLNVNRSAGIEAFVAQIVIGTGFVMILDVNFYTVLTLL